MLFLRQLVDDEIAANRLIRRADMWVWDGHPAASPKLTALVESMIGRQPDEIVAVAADGAVHVDFALPRSGVSLVTIAPAD